MLGTLVTEFHTFRALGSLQFFLEHSLVDYWIGNDWIDWIAMTGLIGLA